MPDIAISIVGERTKLNRANTKSPSLRTTVPESVVNELKVKEGDSLEWERIIHEGKIAIRVKKAGKQE
ncbi:AbrB/MazE/SpoVT family DNA-binding domain-containing protein [Nitrososphaera sp.]|uniref:AbrB/MazE/SpoVT family DNA-binding domain-containing protein n=1 Tax=Nitrososphaera sp. TaxID=1971748 RepID=UPI002EDB350C